MNYEIYIKRFESYPILNPKGYMVGFEIKLKNEKTIYNEVLVPFDMAANKTENEIIEQAWELINIRLTEQVQEIQKESSLLNQKWTPKEFKEKEEEYIK